MTKYLEPDVALEGTEPHVPTRASERRASVDTGDVQASARMAVIAADRNQDNGRLDAVAGCEFVDDRIHLLE